MMESTKSTAMWAAALLGVVVAVWLLAPVLAPFAMAAVLAYVLNPSVNALARVCGGTPGRWFAVLVVETVFLLVAAGLALMIFPILAVEIPLMRDQVPGLLTALNAHVQPLLRHYGIKVAVDEVAIKAFVMTYLNANVESLLTLLLDSLKMGGSLAVAFISNVLLIPVVVFYLLLEWDALLANVRTLAPLRFRVVMDGFFTQADAVLGQYLRGQLLVMAALGVYYAVALSVFGLDLAIPIGVFTGLAVFVPYVGFALGLTLALVAGILQFAADPGLQYALLVVGGVYGLGQVLESFVLTPRLVGERIGLHPLAVIFALMAFAQLFGFVGVVLALPASAVLVVALRRVTGEFGDSPAARVDRP